jgi:hypothetical protein
MYNSVRGVQLLESDREWSFGKRGEKCYFATKHFKPILVSPDTEQHLSQLQSGVDGFRLRSSAAKALESMVQVVRPPRRSIATEVIRRLLAAIRCPWTVPKRCFVVITPQALASDGFRWHAWAYCPMSTTSSETFCWAGLRSMRKPFPLERRHPAFQPQSAFELLHATASPLVSSEYRA